MTCGLVVLTCLRYGTCVVLCAPQDVSGGLSGSLEDIPHVPCLCTGRVRRSQRRETWSHGTGTHLRRARSYQAGSRSCGVEEAARCVWRTLRFDIVRMSWCRPAFYDGTTSPVCARDRRRPGRGWMRRYGPGGGGAGDVTRQSASWGHSPVRVFLTCCKAIGLTYVLHECYHARFRRGPRECARGLLTGTCFAHRAVPDVVAGRPEVRFRRFASGATRRGGGVFPEGGGDYSPVRPCASEKRARELTHWCVCLVLREFRGHRVRVERDGMAK